MTAASLALAMTACSASSERAVTSSAVTAPTTAPAESVASWEPTGIGIDATGRIFFTDCLGGHVYRIDTPGTATMIAGTGISTTAGGLSGEAVPATAADLHCPADVAFDPAGNLIVVDHANNRLRSIDTAGVIHTIIGSGPIGTATDDGTIGGDGGPALAAQLQEPWGIVFDSSGDLLIADRDNHAVRRVDVNGVITTVAGSGDRGFGGDGGPATAAQMSRPQSVAIDASGNVFISDSDNHRVRKVDTNGVISTVVGTGASGYSGDGAAALDAELMDPNGLAFDLRGNLYIADDLANAVRMVDVRGIISTVAGTGEAGFSGDGGRAVAGRLDTPSDVVFDASGHLYITDAGNHRIRRVNPDGTIETYAS